MEFMNFINGKWVKSSSGKTFKSFNPANGRELGVFQSGNEKDVNEAVKSAVKAFPEWSKTPAPERGELLLKIALDMEKNKKKYGELVTKEMGKQISEGNSDAQEAIDVLKYMAGEGRRLFGFTTTSELPDKFAMTVRQPLGPVGLITPWNFPLAIPAWKISAALITGCTAVFKPASDTPLCAVEFVKLFEKHGLPKGVLNMVTGSGKEAGTPIVKHKNLRGVSFTGSKETGKFISENAGLKKVGLELGGKNIIIIMEDADIDLAVEGIVWGAFGTTGQRCTACSRVAVHKSVKKKLEEKLVKETKKLKVGDGMKSDVGPLINKAALDKVSSYAEKGKKEGKLLAGGKKLHSLFFEPTIFTDVSKNAVIAQEEIFGPVLAIIPFKSDEEAVEIANSVEYGLSSAVYTKDINKAMRMIKELETGLTYINSSTIGSEVHLPFGGVKSTGNGAREGGIEGINEFTETKTVYIDYSNKLQKAQMED